MAASEELRSAKKTIKFLDVSVGILNLLRFPCLFGAYIVALYYILNPEFDVAPSTRAILGVSIFGFGVVVYWYLRTLRLRCNAAVRLIRQHNDYWE